MNSVFVESDFAGDKITLEHGKLATQASGSVTVKVGGTVMLVAVVVSPDQVELLDMVPLTVEYRERFYAGGRIPGGFFKREGRPAEHEILSSRLIDRTFRPLLPEGFNHELQIFVTVLSLDPNHPPAVPALVGASTALALSEVPFDHLVGAARVGLVQDELVINPGYEQLEQSSMDLILTATGGKLTVVDLEAKTIPEKHVISAMQRGLQEAHKTVALQQQLLEQVRVEKLKFQPHALSPELKKRLEELAPPLIEQLMTVADKKQRSQQEGAALDQLKEQLAEEFPEQEFLISLGLKELYRRHFRQAVLKSQRRIDGRHPTEVRPLSCEVGVLPRTHGSALFQRGQTQALATVTLGSSEDEQMIDDLLGVDTKRFMLHYNFPGYSVGEVRFLRGPGRREIGHGALAEKSLEPTIPAKEKFPYTIRLVSEILESNGSSSMASACSGCLALMDAGVPVSSPVAGVALGLIKEGEQALLLTDIIGMEDHYGDMDFKVAGNGEGVTAIQLDLKIPGIELELVERALTQAREARLEILGAMTAALAKPRDHLSPYAPRLETLHINPERIGALIGPQGKVIKGIVEKTGVKIDIEQDGSVYVFAQEAKAMHQALEMIQEIAAEVERGKIYMGKVVKILSFGAMVEILPGRVGLVHISELDDRRVERVEDICREGDTMMVKVLEIMEQEGKIRLSRRAAMREMGPQGVEKV